MMYDVIRTANKCYELTVVMS